MDVVLPILEKVDASYVIDKLIDAATAYFFNKLMDVGTTYVRDQYYWKTDLQVEAQHLRRLLPMIQSVVRSAEHRLTSYEVSNLALMKWLRQFKDGIDEAKEVLDELKYRELETKSDSDKSRLSITFDPYVRAAKRFVKCDDVLERLRTCVKNLSTSASDVQEFQTQVTQMVGIGTGQMQQEILPLSHRSRITSSLPVLSFKGREEEKRKIIQYLLGESVEESEIQMSENVHCLPLEAMGGMGKTALAQQVFDHFENVQKEHFHIQIWVCVSTNLNASSLMKTILKYSTGQSESGPSEQIPLKLKEILHSKRFLLVLDDAWDDKNQTEWEKLRALLLCGQKGSWILLTTRKRSVVKMVSKVIRGTMEPIMLPGLSKAECRSLLYEHAFFGRDPNDFLQLKEIGEEIVAKLKGVPLLAKSIGGALNSKLEQDHWVRISRSEVWETSQDSSNEFIPALTLSYGMLPPDLKRCFSYCSIFPQDYKFDKQKLVCMWVAAGIIYSDESEGSDEVIANCCFDMLCNKSFFDVHTYNWSRRTSFYDTTKDLYTMHDMLKDLARHVSRYECCRIVHGSPSSKLDDNAIHHISISITDAHLHKVAKMVCKLKHLRTLWIEYDGDPQKLNNFIRDACKSPRRIRVLIMECFYSGVSRQCWESISDFVKLRFLDISAHRQLSLSKSICKFYFLQVLIGNGDCPILANNANKLTSLRHLYGVKDALAEVGKLTSLQELCFSVGTEPGYKIGELMNMNNLHQLKIKQLSNVRSFEEANNVNLVRKRNLTRLELNYRDEVNSNPDLDQQEVLEALQPPDTIRELFITDYKGSGPAPWMDTLSLSSLTSLRLYACASLEQLPPLWKLPCLKFLKLKQMKAMRSLGCHFSNQSDIQFLVLEELKFFDLPLLEEWNGADEYLWFPHLKSFKIHGCPKLKKIPALPLSIEKLRMVNLGLEALPRSYKGSNGSRTFGGFQKLMSLRSLEINDCSKIVQIGSIDEEDHNLLPSPLKKRKLGGLVVCPKFPSAKLESQVSSSSVFDHSASNKAASILPSSLKYLSISNCDISQESLGRWLQGLISLEHLLVFSCQQLVSLPNRKYLQNLTALRTLKISGCEKLCELESLTALVSLRKLKIDECPKLLAPTFSTLQNPTTTEQSVTEIKMGALPLLEEIVIDNIFYLPSLPTPVRLQTLLIGYLRENPHFPSEIEKWLLQCRKSLDYLYLGRMPHLQSLPTSLERFSSLRILSIHSTSELKSLPKMPTSLGALTINGCSAKLKERCQKNFGLDWPNIKHIADIYIEADE